MKAPSSQIANPPLPWNRPSALAGEALLLASASLLVALCARFTLPLPGTPVPLTLQNFAVILVGLLLGARRGALALGLYLLEGAAGVPVFNPTGPGGLAQLLGPTGGYLISYPLAAFVAGWLSRRKPGFFPALRAAVVAELLLFAAGISWLMILLRVPFARAAVFGLYPFVFAEIMKVMSAAAIAVRWQRVRQT